MEQLEKIMQVIKSDDLYLHRKDDGDFFVSKKKSKYNGEHLYIMIKNGFDIPFDAIIKNHSDKMTDWVDYLLRTE